MATKATKDQKEQVITLSQIDSLITILGDYPEASLPLTMNVNPFGFLLDICKSLGIYDELLLFITKLIQYELPLIELGIKGILLSNLKELVSCSSDPFIPKYMRKKIGSTNSSNGITFSLNDMDFNRLMEINPLGEGAEYSYLGIPRNYRVTFKISQKLDKTNELTKISSWYKDDESKAINKLNEWKNKYDSKYAIVEKSDGTISQGDWYRISEGGRNINQMEYLKSKKKGEEVYGTMYNATYIIDKIVESPELTNSDGSKYYVNITKDFETYADADSYIKSRRQKYRKYYKGVTYQTKEEYEEISNIETQVLITPQELSRAQDFNAFLWFVCNMANFNDPIKLPLTEDSVTIEKNINKNIWEVISQDKLKYLNNYLKDNFNLEYNSFGNEKEGPLGVFKVTETTDIENEESPCGFLGSAFVMHDTQDSSLIDLCIKVDYSDSKKTYTIVPATSDNISLNWYGDRSKYFDFLKYWASPKKEREKSPRNYSKEIGICNIEFDSSVNDTSNDTFFNRNKLRFTVLPKPLVHSPQWLDGLEWPWEFKMILFDEYGNYNSKGKFSCFVTCNEKDEPICKKQENATMKEEYTCYYELANKSGTGQGLYLHIPKKWEGGENLVISKSPTSLDTSYDRIPPSCTYECYPNLTIYEFNYDYVMSQRLFDPKVITGQLIQSVLNCKLGCSGNLNIGIKHNITEGTQRIIEIVKNILTSDTYSSDDCYFNFSNEQYDEMFKKTELKKTQGVHFEGHDRVFSPNIDKINEILSEYDNPNITQAGQIDVLNRAFNEISASITAETDDIESWDIKFNIIQQILEDLTFEIIKSLLTPKIIMLLMVNKQLMGEFTEWQGNVIANLMNILISTISNIVKEIKNMLLSELLEFILGFLKPKIADLAALILKEYLEQYRNQIAALIKNCTFSFGSKSTNATQLDVVDYADIDPVEQVTKDNQC